MSKEELRKSAITYIKQIYKSHREQDIESWEQLLNTLLDYIDESIKCHEEIEHDITK